MKLRPEAHDASNRKQKGKQSAPADGSKTDGLGGRNGGAKELKTKKDCFTFFKLLKTKGRNRNEPDSNDCKIAAID
ncbi:MAG: hypothetical protein ACRD2P_12500 [Terriglobia bacterium]